MVQARERGLRIDRGIERRVTGHPVVTIGFDRKHDQHRVADKAQNFATARADRGGDELEIIVQHTEHLRRLERFGQLGKVAQIAEPQRRMNHVGIAALDHAGEHLFAGTLANVGVHQRARQVPQGLHFEDRHHHVAQPMQ